MNRTITSNVLGAATVLTAIGAGLGVLRPVTDDGPASQDRFRQRSPLEAAIARAAGTTLRPASSTNVCINFSSNPDPSSALVIGELWELRHISCTGADCLIMMSRPPHPSLEDFNPKPSVGTFSAAGSEWTFNWQGLSTDVTGDGAVDREISWDARSCVLGTSFPNHFGFGGAAGAAASFLGDVPASVDRPIGLANPARTFCHLDVCSSFHE